MFRRSFHRLVATVLSSVYLIKTSPENPRSAAIYFHGRLVGSLKTELNGDSVLSSPDRSRLRITPKVDGEIRPFSLWIEDENGTEVLEVKYSLFSHNGRMYMVGNVPENVKPGDTLGGPKYISHLLNFPISKTEQIDHEIRSQLRRYRGVLAGEILGIGLNGHEVKLSDELEDIGLPLSAACYLLFTTPHGKKLLVREK